MQIEMGEMLGSSQPLMPRRTVFHASKAVGRICHPIRPHPHMYMSLCCLASKCSNSVHSVNELELERGGLASTFTTRTDGRMDGWMKSVLAQFSRRGQNKKKNSMALLVHMVCTYIQYAVSASSRPLQVCKQGGGFFFVNVSRPFRRFRRLGKTDRPHLPRCWLAGRSWNCTNTTSRVQSTEHPGLEAMHSAIHRLSRPFCPFSALLPISAIRPSRQG